MIAFATFQVFLARRKREAGEEGRGMTSKDILFVLVRARYLQKIFADPGRDCNVQKNVGRLPWNADESARVIFIY